MCLFKQIKKILLNNKLYTKNKAETQLNSVSLNHAFKFLDNKNYNLFLYYYYHKSCVLD